MLGSCQKTPVDTLVDNTVVALLFTMPSQLTV